MPKYFELLQDKLPPILFTAVVFLFGAIYIALRFAKINGSFKFRKTRREKFLEIQEDLALWEAGSPIHTLMKNQRDAHALAHHAGLFVTGKKRDLLMDFANDNGEFSNFQLQAASVYLQVNGERLTVKDHLANRIHYRVGQFLFAGTLLLQALLITSMIVSTYFLVEPLSLTLRWMIPILITLGLLILFYMMTQPYKWATQIAWGDGSPSD